MFSNSVRPASGFKTAKPIFLILRLRHKLKQPAEKPAIKAAADVVKYLESIPEYEEIKDKLPKSLLRKYKAPESMYLINRQTAKEIANAVQNHLDDSPVVEVNPGLGFLSEELLKRHKSHHYIYETSSHFTPFLEKLKNEYPDRVSYKIADFFEMWKLAFQDKMDEGNRIKELLGDLSTEDNDRIVKIIGSMPRLSFMKHLINTIVFHNSDSQLGRPDLFITMPGHQFDFLTDSDIQLSKYKSVPALFQVLFDYKIIRTVPIVHFLPWTHPPTGKNVSLTDNYHLFLVNITQKAKLPCPPDYLPLLWYFFKPHVFSRSTRVIPMLEQWIPGCGVWLITGQDPPDTRPDLAPGPDDAALPHMTIFTEFGDLNLKQKITVFKKFISWPEFEQCQFRVTMENNLPKSVSHLDDDDGKDVIPAHIEHLDHSDSESES
ncbi:dimethyladenosine transferase 2, mitochondrial [Pectinophora gossypiella]|uniref:rRNA adenine N(6)-methyltransferase n=1 Tax=Pectinophora gossypiella TaxID=13191 RepID=A0A1E1W153_PECGO|nr:dimethyladenosine transferase 2, mitochondrial [Pectinophora gossypiella]